MTGQEFFEKFPVKLNDQQKEAVCAADQFLLLLAVPGSGKTTVLVARLGYMILCRDIAADRILVLTYTVAAAQEMKERFVRFFSWAEIPSPEFRTINGVCAKVILAYGRKIGKTPFSLISDEKIQRKRLAQICQDLTGEYPTESEIRELASKITFIKNMMLTAKEIEALAGKQDTDREEGWEGGKSQNSRRQGKESGNTGSSSGRHQRGQRNGGESQDLPLAEIYAQYCSSLRQEKLMDYDDQMTYTCSILHSSKEMLSALRRQYPYICVDEAQDTSKIQHKIISLITGDTGNLFMVGDEDQSIYGFRAAYPKALLDFENDHKGASVLLMEVNFRSRLQIVEAADRFIQKNRYRHKKRMRAARSAGSEIREIALSGRYKQFTYLCKAAADCQQETAILYRDNDSAVVLIDLLKRAGIPFRYRRTELTFFTSRIVTDIRNIIRFALDQSDEESFLQIYYKLNLYLNKQKAQLACREAQSRGISILDAVLLYTEPGSSLARAVRERKASLKELLTDSAVQALERIRDEMEYGDYLRRCGLSDNKLYILQMLSYKEASARSLLERIGQLEEELLSGSDRQAKLILSTIHSSKGLEYDSVYLIDVIDGIFPDVIPNYWEHASTEEQEAYEEQRRLFYVAVTRAKERLTVFSLTKKSSFVRELIGKPQALQSNGGENADRKESGPYGHKWDLFINAASGPVSRQESVYLKQPAPPKEQESTESIARRYAAFTRQLGEGIMVTHKTFGDGIVTALDEEKGEVKICFPEGNGNTDSARRKLQKNKEIRFQLWLLFEKGLLDIKTI
ncbi:MAG: ATP-dependent helicase [Blautia sp.]|nr:ATP-dependent helicase [Blautia sp.]